MNSEQILDILRNDVKNFNKHFSIDIKLDYFKDDLYGDSCQLRFIINDGTMTFTGRTLQEAYQNYLDFDDDIGKHYDKETEVNGYHIHNKKLFCYVLDASCENLVDAKGSRQLKMAI